MVQLIRCQTLSRTRVGCIPDKGLVIGTQFSLDGSVFDSVNYIGQEFVEIFNGTDFEKTFALFTAEFSDGLAVEVAVHPLACGDDVVEAEILATTYCEVMGRVPMLFRNGIKRFHMRPGNVTFVQDPTWRCAQNQDQMFISSYARDNRWAEDVAESVVPWFAVRYSADRVSQEILDKILEAIPHRLEYFDQHLELLR